MSLASGPFSVDPLSKGGARPVKVSGAISFNDVLFAYPTRPDALVLGRPLERSGGGGQRRGFSLEIKAGETVALVGASGAIKSTGMQLLLRFYEPTKGVVALDGRDDSKLNVHWLRSQIGYVGQEPVLFSTSIFENIARGKEGPTLEEVQATARAANVHEFIEGLTDKYETNVGSKSCLLSGGQKQRIAIAGAIIKDPAIMLLDEATSALDSERQAQVQAALDRLRMLSKRTTLIIAHRLSTVRNADSIAVPQDGCICERGSHAKLISGSSSVYTMLHDQATACDGTGAATAE
ncbi:P-glycoprotein [Tribonema minus]|uniref:p-glycoprotein n=1 Tax=Tribonema minus TaxID=303371 RepID=A0A836CKJ0_9STRA|nr:P-glycoprotein [Tribonema minus]